MELNTSLLGTGEVEHINLRTFYPLSGLASIHPSCANLRVENQPPRAFSKSSLKNFPRLYTAHSKHKKDLSALQTISSRGS